MGRVTARQKNDWGTPGVGALALVLLEMCGIFQVERKHSHADIKGVRTRAWGLGLRQPLWLL